MMWYLPRPHTCTSFAKAVCKPQACMLNICSKNTFGKIPRAISGMGTQYCDAHGSKPRQMKIQVKQDMVRMFASGPPPGEGAGRSGEASSGVRRRIVSRRS